MTTINFYDIDVAFNGEGGKLNSSPNQHTHTKLYGDIIEKFLFPSERKVSFIELKVCRKSRVALEWEVDCCDPPEEKP